MDVMKLLSLWVNAPNPFLSAAELNSDATVLRRLISSFCASLGWAMLSYIYVHAQLQSLVQMEKGTTPWEEAVGMSQSLDRKSTGEGWMLRNKYLTANNPKYRYWT